MEDEFENENGAVRAVRQVQGGFGTRKTRNDAKDTKKLQ